MQQLFKGDNYSREETIRGIMVLVLSTPRSYITDIEFYYNQVELVTKLHNKAVVRGGAGGAFVFLIS